MKRAAVLLACSAVLFLVTSCGNGANSVTGANGNVTVNGASMLKNRAFITNQFSGNVQVVDSQTDQTAYYTVTNNNTGNSTTGGAPSSAVSILASAGSLTWTLLSPDDLETLVYSPTGHTLTFITNSTEAVNGSVPLADWSDMGLYSPDSKFVYIPVPNVTTPASQPGGVQVLNTAAGQITGTVPVPGARYVALSPDGKTLLVFASNSDTAYMIDTTASSLVAVALPGFSRPVNAFFSSDSSTAYVINCGPECGSTVGPPSVMKFSIASKTIAATVPVGGASVGMLSGNNLYVAGYPGGSTGTFDIVDVSSMTRTTANPVAIGDGTHTTMVVNNNKLYIGAITCANTTFGCLSIVDLGTKAADPMPPPRGAVSSLLSVTGRNVIYAIEGGVLDIYDTSTGQLQSKQIGFVGALYGIVQVDP